MLTKLHEPINQGIRLLNLGWRKTIIMASISSNIDLKNQISDFWHMRLLFFFTKRIKFEKRKNRTTCEKRHNFLMRRKIRICRHSFVGGRSDNMLS